MSGYSRSRKSIEPAHMAFTGLTLVVLGPILLRALSVRAADLGVIPVLMLVLTTVGWFWVRRPSAIHWNAYGPRWPSLVALALAALGLGIDSVWMAALGAVVFVIVFARYALAGASWSGLTPSLLLAFLVIPLPQSLGSRLSNWLECRTAASASLILDGLNVNNIVHNHELILDQGSTTLNYAIGANAALVALATGVLLAAWRSDRMVHSLAIFGLAIWSCFLAGIVRLVSEGWVLQQGTSWPSYAFDALQFFAFILLLLSAEQGMRFLLAPITGRHRAAGLAGKLWNQLTADAETLAEQSSEDAPKQKQLDVDELRLPVFCAALLALGVWEATVWANSGAVSANKATSGGLPSLPDLKAREMTATQNALGEWSRLDRKTDEDWAEDIYERDSVRLSIRLEHYVPSATVESGEWNILRASPLWYYRPSEIQGGYECRRLASSTGGFATAWLRDFDSNFNALPSRVSLSRPLATAVRESQNSVLGRTIGAEPVAPFYSIRFLAESALPLSAAQQSDLDQQFKAFLLDLSESFAGMFNETTAGSRQAESVP